MTRYRNRIDAGRQLAHHLDAYQGRTDLVVLGLPRGGVPVAFEVARQLHAPLDVFLVRKIGVPGHPELAMGAIAEGGIKVLSHRLIRDLAIPARLVEQVASRERLELDRHDALFRAGRERPSVTGRTVILIDDGLATGATMEAAVVALREQKPSRIVVAAPVGARETCARLAALADEVVCPLTPEPFFAVGQWYENFDPTTDDEVRRRLAGAPAAWDTADYAEANPSGL
jgi:putative phosphoribosyl transferase